MVFASGTFLFIFLPVTLAGYWLFRNRSVNILNGFLLVMSMGFYLNSGIRQFVMLLVSIGVNYMFALLISKSVQKRLSHKIFLALAVIYDIGMLFVFKYMTFIRIEALKIAGIDTGHVMEIALPRGISFYTFQALSYVIDVYRDSGLVEKNISNVALYISFFPQLIAGPIVRWDSIRDDLRMRPWKSGWGEIMVYSVLQ